MKHKDPDRLHRHITILLLLKVCLLWLIWHNWFSQPAAPHMQMPPQRVDAHFLLGPLPNGPSAPTSDSNPHL